MRSPRRPLLVLAALVALSCGAAAILRHRGRCTVPRPRQNMSWHAYLGGDAAVVWADGESEVETRLRGTPAPAIPFLREHIRNFPRGPSGLPFIPVKILAAPDTPFARIRRAMQVWYLLPHIILNPDQTDYRTTVFPETSGLNEQSTDLYLLSPDSD